MVRFTGSHSTKCKDLGITLEKSKCRASNVQIKKKKKVKISNASL